MMKMERVKKIILYFFQVNLSHNKFSFISRKTFPSDPWIPYKLQEIDLSYNSMPLITYDLVFGSSKLEKLNLSHNAIADIRRGKFTKRVNRPKLFHNPIKNKNLI